MIVPIDLEPPRCESCRYLWYGKCHWGPTAPLIISPETHWCGQWEPREEVRCHDDNEVQRSQ